MLGAMSPYPDICPSSNVVEPTGLLTTVPTSVADELGGMGVGGRVPAAGPGGIGIGTAGVASFFSWSLSLSVCVSSWSAANLAPPALPYVGGVGVTYSRGTYRG